MLFSTLSKVECGTYILLWALVKLEILLRAGQTTLVIFEIAEHRLNWTYKLQWAKYTYEGKTLGSLSMSATAFDL